MPLYYTSYRVRVKRKFPHQLLFYSLFQDTTTQDTTQSFYSIKYIMYFLVAHYYNTINNTRPTLKLGTPPAHQHINTTIWILTTEEVNII